MTRKLISLAFVLTTLFTCPVLALGQAQSIKLEVSDADNIRTILSKVENKPVTLILSSEKEVTGKVYKVANNLVHITDLSGKEFYDAVVKVDSITAIIVRAR